MCILFRYTQRVREDDDPRDPISELREFDWDDGNSAKSWKKHSVRPSECEELFGERPLLISADFAHSAEEPRHFALGQTRAGRQLFVVFTIRGRRLRVISARDMSRKERSAYEKARAKEERDDPPSNSTLR